MTKGKQDFRIENGVNQLCNAVVIGAGIFPFTQAQGNVFDFTAFSVYIYFAFTSLVIVVELCTLLRYEAIVLKYRRGPVRGFRDKG